MMDKALDVWVDGTCSFKGVECFMTPPVLIILHAVDSPTHNK